MTPLRCCFGCVRRPRRQNESIVQGVSVTCPVKSVALLVGSNNPRGSVIPEHKNVRRNFSELWSYRYNAKDMARTDRRIEQLLPAKVSDRDRNVSGKRSLVVINIMLV